jgi:acetyl esterase
MRQMTPKRGPMPTPSEPIAPYPGMALTDKMRAAVEVEERFVPGPSGHPDVRVLIYRPIGAGALPLVANFHGGAFAMRADHFPAGDARIAMLGTTLVSVDYRSLPDHTFPLGVEDCYAALCWAVDALDVDKHRDAVTGGSAGGALAAAVTLMARDRSGPHIAFQALRIPVLDDRMLTPSMRQFGEGHPGFNAVSADRMWRDYLGADRDVKDTSPYAAPARAADLSGLPPAFILVNGLDPLRDEGIEYAMRLMAAGVPVELYCVPGAYHGAEPLDLRTVRAGERLMAEAISAALT